MNKTVNAPVNRASRATGLAGKSLLKQWRPRPESNRGARICNPLRHHSATGPCQRDADR